MNYVSIDIETTGLDPSYCQVLEFGAVLETWKGPVFQQPTFHRYILHDRIVGEPYALALNAEIIKRIAQRDSRFAYCRPDELGSQFHEWLQSYGLLHEVGEKLIAAGKNFAGFDLQFLKQLPLFTPTYISFHHRAIDPGSMYFCPAEDAEVPSTAECKKRAGLNGEVAHTAVADALDVIRLIRAR